MPQKCACIATFPKIIKAAAIVMITFDHVAAETQINTIISIANRPLQGHIPPGCPGGQQVLRKLRAEARLSQLFLFNLFLVFQ